MNNKLKICIRFFFGFGGGGGGGGGGGFGLFDDQYWFMLTMAKGMYIPFKGENSQFREQKKRFTIL